MAMTLRLSDTAEADLDTIVEQMRLPNKTAAIEAALHEMASRSSQVDRARAHVARIMVRDADLMERLGR